MNGGPLFFFEKKCLGLEGGQSYDIHLAEVPLLSIYP